MRRAQTGEQTALKQEKTVRDRFSANGVMTGRSLLAAIRNIGHEPAIVQSLVLDALYYQRAENGREPVETLEVILREEGEYLSAEQLEGITGALREYNICRSIPSRVLDALLELVGRNISSATLDQAPWLCVALRLQIGCFSARRLKKLITFAVKLGGVAAPYEGEYLRTIESCCQIGDVSVKGFREFAQDQLQNLEGDSAALDDLGKECQMCVSKVGSILQKFSIQDNRDARNQQIVNKCIQYVEEKVRTRNVVLRVVIALFAFCAILLAIVGTALIGWGKAEPILYFISVVMAGVGVIYWCVIKQPMSVSRFLERHGKKYKERLEGRLGICSEIVKETARGQVTS